MFASNTKKKKVLVKTTATFHSIYLIITITIYE